MGATDLRVAQALGLASVLSGWLLVLKPGWPQAVLFVVLVIGLVRRNLTSAPERRTTTFRMTPP